MNNNTPSVTQVTYRLKTEVYLLKLLKMGNSCMYTAMSSEVEVHKLIFFITLLSPDPKV
jgi:hypothetical protein